MVQVNFGTVATIENTESSNVENDFLSSYPTIQKFQTLIIRDPGLIQLPIADQDGTACKIVKTHAAIARKIVLWEAHRVNSIPIVPTPDESNSNEVLLSCQLLTQAPNTQVDGETRTFIMAGVYTYALLVPPEDCKSGLKTGKVPYDSSAPAGGFEIMEQHFSTEIIQ